MRFLFLLDRSIDRFFNLDSYLENQRRRALRDTQGYYFPYKQYTLKDYKDLQRSEATKNPYAPLQDPLTERVRYFSYENIVCLQFSSFLKKEQPRKPPSNVSQRSVKPLGPLKPIHPDPEKSSKRERVKLNRCSCFRLTFLVLGVGIRQSSSFKTSGSKRLKR